MAYKALYRTYRPQTFEEVAGQKHIIKTLKNALEQNKIAHAYLFCGPRGTGKTTMARLFAKALNCQEGVGHQCNHCESCEQITNGTHPDVIEIDAASNNGVNDVRQLITTVNYTPISASKKVYIIDEVHMMSKDAFNALLKTLEEPPEHVIFILATTEPHNIIPTILSRCQRYDFTKVSNSDIYEKLIEILDKEGITYDESAVGAIISLADGGVRDALSILDQVLAYSGNTLKESDVFTLFGLTSIPEKIEFIKAIRNGDVALCLKKISQFNDGGVDIKRLTSDLLEILKDVLVMKKTQDESNLSLIDEFTAVELCEIFDTHSLNEMIGTILKTQSDYKTVSNIKTLFEVTILKLCTINDVEEERPVIKQPIIQQPKPEPQVQVIQEPVIESAPVVEQIIEPVVQETVAPQVSEPEPVVEQPIEIKEVVEEPVVKQVDNSWLNNISSEVKSVQLEGEQYEIDDETIIKLMVLGKNFAQERKDLIARWSDLDNLTDHPTLGEVVILVKDGKPFIITKDIVVLVYQSTRLANRANIKANQEALSEVLSEFIGRPLFVYSLSRDESARLIKMHGNLAEISKLPRASEIQINVEEIK